MGRKPKAGGAEGKRTDPAQSRRFIEGARQAGVDEASEAFERAFERITAQKQPAPVKKRTSSPAKKPRTGR